MNNKTKFSNLLRRFKLIFIADKLNYYVNQFKNKSKNKKKVPNGTPTHGAPLVSSRLQNSK